MGNQGTFTKNLRQIVTNFELLYHLIYLAFCVLALFMHPFFYSVLVNYTPLTWFKLELIKSCPLQLFDVVYREETLLNVIRSVTRNGRSIILTAVLALILVYMFSIIGFMFFQDDFLVEVDSEFIRNNSEKILPAVAKISCFCLQQRDKQKRFSPRRLALLKRTALRSNTSACTVERVRI
jgi:inositol 1,4,5-triphosphate receptor type 1